MIRSLSPQTFRQMRDILYAPHLQLHGGDLMDNMSVARSGQTSCSNDQERETADHCEPDISQPLNSESRPHSSRDCATWTELDQLLFNQRPYLRLVDRRSCSGSSFDSAKSHQKCVRWSWISTFSISEVSNISLLELPLDVSDLYNSHLWSVTTGAPVTLDSMSTHRSTTRRLPLVHSRAELNEFVSHLFNAACGRNTDFLKTLLQSQRTRWQYSKWFLQRISGFVASCVEHSGTTQARHVLEDLLCAYDILDDCELTEYNTFSVVGSDCLQDKSLQGSLNKAEKTLLRSIERLRLVGDHTPEHYSIVLLSEMLLDQVRMAWAEICLVRGVEKGKVTGYDTRISSSSGPEMRWVIGYLEIIYEHQDNFMHAEKMLNRLMESLSRSEVPEKLITIFEELGWTRMRQHDYCGAEHLFTSALEYNGDGRPVDYHQAHRILLRLGISYHEQGKEEVARACSNHALRHRDSVQKNDPNKPVVRFNAGVVCDRLGRFREAKGILANALPDHIKRYGRSNLNTLEVAGLLATVCEKQGRYVEAWEYLTNHGFEVEKVDKRRWNKDVWLPRPGRRPIASILFN